MLKIGFWLVWKSSRCFNIMLKSFELWNEWRNISLLLNHAYILLTQSRFFFVVVSSSLLLFFFFLPFVFQSTHDYQSFLSISFLIKNLLCVVMSCYCLSKKFHFENCMRGGKKNSESWQYIFFSACIARKKLQISCERK